MSASGLVGFEALNTRARILRSRTPGFRPSVNSKAAALSTWGVWVLPNCAAQCSLSYDA